MATQPATTNDTWATPEAPRYYYVDAIDGERYALLVGPFRTLAEAEAWVTPARKLARTLDPKSHFYAFWVTCWVNGLRTGILNTRLGVTS